MSHKRAPHSPTPPPPPQQAGKSSEEPEAGKKRKATRSTSAAAVNFLSPKDALVLYENELAERATPRDERGCIFSTRAVAQGAYARMVIPRKFIRKGLPNREPVPTSKEREVCTKVHRPEHRVNSAPNRSRSHIWPLDPQVPSHHIGTKATSSTPALEEKSVKPT